MNKHFINWLETQTYKLLWSRRGGTRTRIWGISIYDQNCDLSIIRDWKGIIQYYEMML